MNPNLMPLALYDETSADKNLKAAEMLFKSGLLPTHIKSPQAALYIVQRGMLLGLDPMSALENTYLVNGRIFLGIHAAQGIISSRGGKWKVVENSRQKAEVQFFREGWDSITSSFDQNDAKISGIAGKTAFLQHTADILYANAFRKGARKMFSDWLMGMSILDEQEYRGRMVDVEVLPVEPTEEPPKEKPRRERKSQVTPDSDAGSPPAAPLATTEPKEEEPALAEEAKVIPPKVQVDEAPWCPEISSHRLVLTKVCNDLQIPTAWRSENRKLVFSALESEATNTESSVKAVIEKLYSQAK
jgi:hypothetical protein